MNFDFLKDARGMDYVYKKCTEAEKLATTMPMQSMFTARKSAEVLARFVYMAAHNQAMENLSFAEILSDHTVREFIHSRDIMDAFHYIRKSGNRAAHGEADDTVEDAVSVLQDLHYVSGETACMLGLINDYPAFEDQISDYQEEVLPNNEDAGEIARKMFLDYVEAFNAQQERDKYIEEKDYNWLRYAIEGNVDMREYLEFKYRMRQPELIDYIQNYIHSLMLLSVERAPEKAEELDLAHPVVLDAKLKINGMTYESADTERFLSALNELLPTADGFVLDIHLEGVLREYYNDDPSIENARFNMIRKDAVWTGAGMLDILSMYKRRNAFTYKLIVFYPDSGESIYEKIQNGKEIDVPSTFNTSIIEKEFANNWWTWELSLWTEFDYEAYPELLKELQDIVRRSIPESELKYCENAWAEGDVHLLCNGIQWNCRSLKEVQSFLDQLNRVLLPIRDELDAGADGTWENREEFAVASWDWTDEGFKVMGTIL